MPKGGFEPPAGTVPRTVTRRLSALGYSRPAAEIFITHNWHRISESEQFKFLGVQIVTCRGKLMVRILFEN